MAVRLVNEGYEVTPDRASADVIIVHTCGFIQDAKKESIDGILAALDLSGEPGSAGVSRPQKVIVTGCLAQRYPKQLLAEIPEIAGLAGTSAPKGVVDLVNGVLEGTRPVEVGGAGRGAPGGEGLRLVREGPACAYLRISEGCRHRCTYCAIPGMRGPLASRPPGEIVKEARALAGSGVSEINLIAEDLADYGFEWDGKRHLPALLSELSAIEELRWIRLLYVRPDGVTPELSDAMAGPKVVPYIDLPIENGSAAILKRMGRPGPDQIIRAVELLRSRVPELSLRTTVIAGFPGETENDLKDTFNLLQAIKAHRVGAFAFSKEEGTPAYSLPNPVPEEIAKDRAERIRKFGLALAKRHGAGMVGKVTPCLLTGPSPRPGYWLARGFHQGPEVDGKIHIKFGAAEPGPETSGEVVPRRGLIIPARIEDASVLDLFASPAR